MQSWICPFNFVDCTEDTIVADVILRDRMRPQTAAAKYLRATDGIERRDLALSILYDLCFVPCCNFRMFRTAGEDREQYMTGRRTSGKVRGRINYSENISPFFRWNQSSEAFDLFRK